MSNFSWQSQDIEWIEQVRQLLLELARACLGDTPKLPENLSQRAIPMTQKAQELLKLAREQGYSGNEITWVEQVNQLFFDLARVALAERPKLPDHLSQTLLSLAQKAQEIKDTAVITPVISPVYPVSPPAEEDLLKSPEVLLELLEKSIKQQWSASANSNAPEWQQLLNLVEISQSLYQRLQT